MCQYEFVLLKSSGQPTLSRKRTDTADDHVNPVLTPQGDDMHESYEGCLSVPDLRGKVARYKRLHVEYLDRHGTHSLDVSGIKAVTYQHECDYLDGKLFVDRVKDRTTLTTWKNYHRHHSG